MSRDYADPDCPDCRGLGFIYGASMLDGGRSCHCMMDALKLQNMEKVWPSLSEATEIPDLRLNPPLRSLLKRDLWITAQEMVFRAHLKAVAFTQDTMWDARVISDLDLVETWLKTAKAQGHKIYDSEIDNHKGKFIAMDIAELVTPFDLVILKLGVKQAPNKETHSVLLEALATRRHLGRPVWIVDQPDQRIDNMAHRGYSELLEGILSHWPHLGLVGRDVKLISGAVPVKEPELVSTISTDEILEVPEKAVEEIDEALSNLGEEVTPEKPEKVDPMIEALQANEQKAAEKNKYKKKKNRRNKK